jgi:NADH-quinone oxidoreductase subunit J
LPLESVLFYVFGAAAVVASLLVIGQRNTLYSVLLLIASFGALAGLYILLDAPFVAAIQIIVYAGAIMVLFLFVVMLLNAPTEGPEPAEGGQAEPRPATAGATESAALARRRARRFGVALAIAMALELVWALLRGTADEGFGETSVSSVRTVGRVLFTDYVFAFEVTSVLILVAMVGAVVLARRETDAGGR